MRSLDLKWAFWTLAVVAMLFFWMGRASAWQVVENPDGTFRMEKTYFECGKPEPCENNMVKEIEYPEGSPKSWKQAGFLMRGYWESTVNGHIKNKQKDYFEDREKLIKMGHLDLVKLGDENDIWRSDDWHKRFEKKEIIKATKTDGFRKLVLYKSDTFDYPKISDICGSDKNDLHDSSWYCTANRNSDSFAECNSTKSCIKLFDNYGKDNFIQNCLRLMFENNNKNVNKD